MHYYIEDINVDPKRKDRISSVDSIQFDLLPASGNIYVNIDEKDLSGKLTRASVIIPFLELKNACEYLEQK